MSDNKDQDINPSSEDTIGPDMPGNKRPPSDPFDMDDNRTRIAPPGQSLAALAALANASARATDHPEDDNRTRIAPKRHAEPTNGYATIPGSSAQAQERSDVRQVGRYQILELLGRGGMATVFKAHDPGIDRTIAIKFLHASLCEDEEYRNRFLREARAAGMLTHPNIATIFDVGEIEGRPYIAMELLDGEPLSDLMSQGATFSVKQVLEMGIQLARALDYAHSKGVVHRDIKPANIIVSKNRNSIKVADFGIAHLESASRTQHTRIGDVIGTPQYMSPEQAMGEKVDGRSDLFSVGIVLYQLITGQKPFEADTIVALMMKIAKESPTTIQKLRPETPAALRRVIDRCLTKQPDRRYQTGKELADALVKLIRTLEEERPDRPRIMPLRVKWTLMMALFVAAVMGVTATVVTQRQQEALVAQVTDYGASLARFMATQSAVPALSEDWISVEVFIQEVMRSQDFKALTVVDRGGIVRASSNPSIIEQTYQPPRGELLSNPGGTVQVRRVELDGESVINFDAPITFQTKEIGRIALDLPEAPLVRVSRLAIGLMVALVLATIAAVAAGTWILANWFSRPIRLLEESMRELGAGRLDHRIGERRKDEFGLLYQSFDEMAASLEQHWARDQDAQSSPPRPSPIQMPLGEPPTEMAEDVAEEVRRAQAGPVRS
ncbi:MAG: protein kinase [Rhodocyclaceae bacterium]|nr:protein kinase [Rhodocyclaceae bacterium]